MKRLILIILSLVLTIAFASCTVIQNDPEDTTSVKSDSSSDTGKDDKQTGTESNTDGSEQQSDTSNTEDTTPDEIAITETVLYDKDGVKVVAKEWAESFWGDGIKIYIENNTDKDFYLQTNYVVVNNFMMPSVLFSAEVPAGKKTNETLSFDDDFLKKTGITKIGHIEMDMYTYDLEEFEIIAELGYAEIKTNLYDQMDGTSGDGVLLLEQNGIKVIGKYIEEDNFWGKAVVLYMESDKDVIIQAEDLSVNDFGVTALSSTDILAGRKVVDSITIFDDDLEENDITEIEKIEFKLKVLDPDTYDTIFVSDIITCTPDK